MTNDSRPARVHIGFDGAAAWTTTIYWLNDDGTMTIQATGDDNAPDGAFGTLVRETSREVQEIFTPRGANQDPSAASTACPCGAPLPPRARSAYCGPDCEPSPRARDDIRGTAASWRPDLVTAAHEDDLYLITTWPVDGGRTLRILHRGPRSARRGEVRLDDGHRFVGVRVRLPAEDTPHVLHVLAHDRLAALAAELDDPAQLAPPAAHDGAGIGAPVFDEYGAINSVAAGQPVRLRLTRRWAVDHIHMSWPSDIVHRDHAAPAARYARARPVHLSRVLNSYLAGLSTHAQIDRLLDEYVPVAARQADRDHAGFGDDLRILTWHLVEHADQLCSICTVGALYLALANHRGGQTTSGIHTSMAHGLYADMLWLVEQTCTADPGYCTG